MPTLRLIPRDQRFFDLFEQAGANLVATARAVQELLDDYRELPTKLERLHELEHRGDTLTHDVMRALNQTFVTPLDREDISGLIHAVDDVVDRAWAAAARLDIYRIEEATEPARQLARILVQQAEALERALPLLRRKSDMQRIMPLTLEIDHLESEADHQLREGLRSLYADPHDPVNVVLSIKWREIYDFLEDATDRCEDVANVLEGIVLKHG
jgi:predicted phosphate transport protein (TIGR00153 family)